MAKNKPARKRTNSPFAKNLSKILEERGLSQKAASEIAEVGPATINDWLTGSTPNDPLAVQRLCKALQCDFEWILTGKSSDRNIQEISMSELFETEKDPSFSGLFQISATRLKRRGEKK